MAASIRTNLAAYYSQQNLKGASEKAELSIARLSSGNRIIRAADDVAALSIGTVLRTNVNTLKTALQNAQQANSLLQVADGGLKNIGEILQRQKALSTQANSGQLSDTERSFLNQEFQNLKSEIDRLVDNTKFNAVSLLDGSIGNSARITTNVNKIAFGSGTGAARTGNTFDFTANATDGQYITVNGSRVYFTTNTALQKDRVLIGGNQTVTANNLSNFLNSSIDAGAGASRYTVATDVVTQVYNGGDGLGINNLGFANGTLAGTVTNAAAGFAGADFVEGLGLFKTSAVGDRNDSIITSLKGTTGGAAVLPGVDTTFLHSNKDFVGNISGITATFNGTANQVTVSVKVGDITYTSNAAVTTNPGADATITMVGRDSLNNLHGYFTINVAGGGGITVGNQAEADTYAGRLNKAFETIDFYQTRDVSSYTGQGIIYTNGVQTGSLVNSRVNFRTNDAESKFEVQDIKVEAPKVGQPDGKITITVNGQDYVTQGGIGSSVGSTTAGVRNALIFINTADAGKSITFETGATNTIAFDTTAKAKSFEEALKDAFGLGAGAGGIDFQTGNSSADSIKVAIKSADTGKLYDGKTLDISTTLGAIDAGAQLDVAINYVTGLRADVGGLQSRFDYASANLEVAIQNQDAARATFLDADISAESTSFASAQVLLQASISVLTQSNLLPQNLLKLIG